MAPRGSRLGPDGEWYVVDPSAPSLFADVRSPTPGRQRKPRRDSTPPRLVSGAVPSTTRPTSSDMPTASAHPRALSHGPGLQLVAVPGSLRTVSSGGEARQRRNSRGVRRGGGLLVRQRASGAVSSSTNGHHWWRCSCCSRRRFARVFRGVRRQQGHWRKTSREQPARWHDQGPASQRRPRHGFWRPLVWQCRHRRKLGGESTCSISPAKSRLEG